MSEHRDAIGAAIEAYSDHMYAWVEGPEVNRPSLDAAIDAVIAACKVTHGP